MMKKELKNKISIKIFELNNIPFKGIFKFRNGFLTSDIDNNGVSLLCRIFENTQIGNKLKTSLGYDLVKLLIENGVDISPVYNINQCENILQFAILSRINKEDFNNISYKEYELLFKKFDYELTRRSVFDIDLYNKYNEKVNKIKNILTENENEKFKKLINSSKESIKKTHII